METVGIIGGLGPETTAKFYLELIRLCLDKNKSNLLKVKIIDISKGEF